MKLRFPLFFLCAFVLIGLLTNSCKKSNPDYIGDLLVGQWQLSSIIVQQHIGQTTPSTIALDTACNLTQTFKFNADNTCTYTNYSCNTQTTTGHWSLSADKLFLNSDIICQDSTMRKIKPFHEAAIYNLGQYSLILRTGDLLTYYAPTQSHVDTTYGFIRVK